MTRRSKLRAFELGALDCVSQPFEAAELRARLHAALKIKRQLTNCSGINAS